MDAAGLPVAVTDPNQHVRRRERDLFGRVRKAVAPDGGTTEYDRDPELRITKVANPAGMTWSYEHDPAGRLVQETDFNGRVVDRTFYAIVTDLVGTPAELWDVAANALAGATRTTLYGQTEWDPRTTQTCPLRFPGQYYDDETGLHYNFHRYYDPRAARYVSPDPLGLSPAPNQHSYPHDPTSWIDPLGLQSCKDPSWGGEQEYKNHRHAATGSRFMRALDHIFDRHNWNSTFEDVSRFGKGFGRGDIKGIVEESIRGGSISSQYRDAEGKLVKWFTHDFGISVGTDIHGRKTVGVIVQTIDDVIRTAFPL